jgi:hypothetical protein
VLAAASAFGGAACGSIADDDAKTTEEALLEPAGPVAGVTTLVVLPHGDTLTVPFGYSFKRQQGVDSLVGTLVDGTGKRVFEYDACGQAGERIEEPQGQVDTAVNTTFCYGRHPESWPGLLVTYEDRGPSNFIFDPHIPDDQALKLARTLTATQNPSEEICHFEDR